MVTNTKAGINSRTTLVFWVLTGDHVDGVEDERVRTSIVHSLHLAIQPGGGVNVRLIEPQSFRDSNGRTLGSKAPAAVD